MPSIDACNVGPLPYLELLNHTGMVPRGPSSGIGSTHPLYVRMRNMCPIVHAQTHHTSSLPDEVCAQLTLDEVRRSQIRANLALQWQNAPSAIPADIRAMSSRYASVLHHEKYANTRFSA